MPLTNTRGFRAPLLLSDHFGRHGVRVGITTETDYEDNADAFLCPTCPPSALEFRRRNGDLVRYDQVGDVFAVLARDGYIKTYLRPDPLVHLEPTNLDYYRREQAKG